MKSSLKLILRYGPMWLSNFPWIQKRIHKLSGNIFHPSARIHYGSKLMIKGGITLGENSQIHKGTEILSHWMLYSKDGEPITSNGDVVIGKGAIIGKNIKLPPGTVVPPHSCIMSPSDIHATCMSIWDNHGSRPLTEASQELQSKKPFFVLGTGRSGTHSIAETFARQDNWTGRHEHYPWLTALGYKKHLQQISSKDVAQGLLLRWNQYYANSEFVLDSDQRFFNLVPELANIFPYSKFIHIIRPLSSFVQSAKPRGWFNAPEMVHHRWSYYRPQNTSISDELWTNLSQVERMIWYWTFVNQTILNDLKAIPDTNKLVTWLGSTNLESEIADFCGLESIDVPRSNTSRKSGIQKSHLSKEELSLCRLAEQEFLSDNPNLPIIKCD